MSLRTVFLGLSRRQLVPRIQPSSRPFSITSGLTHPRKDSQHKDSINTEATEYSKSGTDDGAAKQEDAAFDPKTTSPEKEKEVAGKGVRDGNPLEASPANQEISKPSGKSEGA